MLSHLEKENYHGNWNLGSHQTDEVAVELRDTHVSETARDSFVDLDAVSFRIEILVDSVRDCREDDDGDSDTKAVGEESSSFDDRVLRLAFETVEEPPREVEEGQS